MKRTEWMAVAAFFAVLAILGISLPVAAQDLKNDSWRLVDVEVDKVYDGYNPNQRVETLAASERIFHVGWFNNGKKLDATVTFTQVPDTITAMSPYTMAATVSLEVGQVFIKQPDGVFYSKFFWSLPSPETDSQVFGCCAVPGQANKREFTLSVTRKAADGRFYPLNKGDDPREGRSDFWEGLYVSFHLDDVKVSCAMVVRFHYKWQGPQLPKLDCDLGTTWDVPNGGGEKWIRRGSSNIFDVVNGHEYHTGDNPGKINAVVTLNLPLQGNSLTAVGHTTADFPDQECFYQGTIRRSQWGNNKYPLGFTEVCSDPVRFFLGNQTAGTLLECKVDQQGSTAANPKIANSTGQPKVAAKTPVPQPTQDPAPAANLPKAAQNPFALSGQWSGVYSDGKAIVATSTLKIVEGANGLITGNEGGMKIENGRRIGDLMTWEYLNQYNGCIDYAVVLVISNSGTLNGTYSQKNRCAGQSTYTPEWNVSFKKQ
jgi:hypothetical protein